MASTNVAMKKERISAIVLICAIIATTSAQRDNGPQWSWACDQSAGLCRRLGSGDVGGVGLEACRLSCGPGGALWPLPTGPVALGTRLVALNPETVAFTYAGTSQTTASLLADAVNIFQGNLRALLPPKARRRPWRAPAGSSDLSIAFSIDSSSSPLEEDLLMWDTDEGYSLEVKSSGGGYVDAVVNASSFFGARHALETLSQMAAWDAGVIKMVADASVLDDRPFYPHRGLLVDPARNFLPLPALYRQLDAMAACKLNVLHLHLTDSQSFAYASKRVPILSKWGAQQPGLAYTAEDVAALARYALRRGIRLLPELDAPAHAAAGWGAASDQLGLGPLAVCVRRQPWRAFCIEPPCGQLNPANPNLYPILGELFTDMNEDFGARERTATGELGSLVHMGGDEVHFGCWNASDEVVSWMESRGYPRTKEGFVRAWAEFQDRALSFGPSTAILWTSDLTGSGAVEEYLDKGRYVIQAWMPAGDPMPTDLLAKGYRVIFSTKDAWYLDHGYGNWKGSSTSGYPFHPWQVGYDNALPQRRWRSGGEVLGGEVAIWGEMVDESSLDAKTWPRAAAAAERLWSNPMTGARGGAKGSWIKARRRMMTHRERLVGRGVGADALQPKWCFFNEGECD
ncbi:chitooligosaccharidolytic beta-N-acetylglucosaminidase-like isoform X2 [Ischnura elegans]|nr:chitooligosaccharidolytic beta-N-acetylglucosaminidase-like isoform X2 [Ischnura elegans]